MTRRRRVSLALVGAAAAAAWLEALHIGRELGLAFDPEDFALTAGAFNRYRGRSRTGSN